jgi:hypothetical protein
MRGNDRPRLVRLTPTRIAELVDSFLGLHDKTNREVAKWAKRWGVLGLCGSGLPLCHAIRPSGLPGCKANGIAKRGYTLESCDRYRDYSAQLRAAMRIIECIQDGKPVDEKDHAVLAKEMCLARFSVGGDERFVVTRYLSFMLLQSGVWPELNWFDGKRPELTLWNRASVIGQLVGRITFRAAGIDSITLCDRCGKPIVFQQHRKGKKGLVCRQCGRREQWAESKRRRRAAERI